MWGEKIKNNLGQIKKISELQVTQNFKRDGRLENSSFFVKSFYMGLIGKQYGRIGKSLQNP